MNPIERAHLTHAFLTGAEVAEEDRQHLIATPIVFWTLAESYSDDRGPACSSKGGLCLTVFGKDAGFVAPMSDASRWALGVTRLDDPDRVLQAEFAERVADARRRGFVGEDADIGPDLMRWEGRAPSNIPQPGNTVVVVIEAVRGPWRWEDEGVAELAHLLREPVPEALAA